MMPLSRGIALAASMQVGIVCADTLSQAFDDGMQALLTGNYAEAYCTWRPLAEQGHAEAQYHIGWLYANGNGLAVDVERALAYWHQAAGQGHADAQFAVGLAYTTGEGMKKDLDEAVRWYLQAARQGHPDAREILMRLNGDQTVRLLETHPDVATESWFGWTGEVSGERINVRAGPGTSHAIVAHLERGQTVRVVGQRGDWHMVVLPSDAARDGGMTAWIYKTLLSGAGG